MALIKCPECGNMISDKAQRCPKCGCPVWQGMASSPNRIVNNGGVDYYPEKSYSRKWLYAVIGLLAAVLVGGGIVAYNKLSYDNENSAAATTDSTSVDGGQAPHVNPTQIPDGDYCYEGHWKSQKHEAQACRMVFAKQGNRLSNCSYTNLRYSTTIPLTGSIQNDKLHFVGKINGKDLVIDLQPSDLDATQMNGTGTDYAHSGDRAALELSRVEQAVGQRVVEYVEPVDVAAERVMAAADAAVAAEAVEEAAAAVEAAAEYAEGASGSSSYDYGSSSRSYRFSSADDVIGWLTDKTFYNGSRRLRIRPSGVWLNDYCATYAPVVERYESWKALIRAMTATGQRLSFFVNPIDGEITDEAGDVFRLR